MRHGQRLMREPRLRTPPTLVSRASERQRAKTRDPGASRQNRCTCRPWVPGLASLARDTNSLRNLARRRHPPDRRRGAAAPTKADETAGGVVEVVESVEEMHAGIHERRPHAADQIER